MEFKGKPGEPLPGKVVDPSDLPFVESVDIAEVFVQQLPEPTEAGENVAVHIRLPEPNNEELAGSLVRVIGDPERPMMLVSSDALLELGLIKESPGDGFFTAFASLSEEQIALRKATEKELQGDKEGSKELLVFDGRQPIAITTGLTFDVQAFEAGKAIALGPCPIAPASTPARWEEALLITDLSVVRDPSRTNDLCDPGNDNTNGVWTFKHLMTQMAINSGLSPNTFVAKWLETWLHDQTINGDVVPRRVDMYNLVIQPWAAASGISSSFNPMTGVLTLGGALNLNKAPFRLSAIVNRIDLGESTGGGGMYGGGGIPTTAGELRFVFGVQNSSCQQLPFSVIFEYGVPRTGCTAIKAWANEWIKLSKPAQLPRFSAAWRAHLETLTQSVVLANAAPARGNKSALNQIRTNENALDPMGQWELREFTLTTEHLTGPDTPATGPLRPHTVALTPDDGNYNNLVDWRLDNWALFASGGAIFSQVDPAASFTTIPTVNKCTPKYQMPLQVGGQPLRGGNSLIFPVTSWNLDWASNTSAREVCSREQFSLNTCNGCHFGDTSTSFFHVDPTVAPAVLSSFLTGAGGLWSVPDQQWGSSTANMQFNDLGRRHQRLYQISCTMCSNQFPIASLVQQMAKIRDVIPIDTMPSDDNPFKVGGIFDISTVKQLLSELKPGADGEVQDLELDRFTGTTQVFVH